MKKVQVYQSKLLCSPAGESRRRNAKKGRSCNPFCSFVAWSVEEGLLYTCILMVSWLIPQFLLLSTHLKQIISCVCAWGQDGDV
jgi:hypothetical protein